MLFCVYISLLCFLSFVLAFFASLYPLLFLSLYICSLLPPPPQFTPVAPELTSWVSVSQAAARAEAQRKEAEAQQKVRGGGGCAFFRVLRLYGRMCGDVAVLTLRGLVSERVCTTWLATSSQCYLARLAGGR